MNYPGEKTFMQLWHQLLSNGWEARKPRGLSRHHSYVKSGVKGRLDESKRGLDFFVGGEELMAFGRKEGLLALANPATQPTKDTPKETSTEPAVSVPAPAVTLASVVSTAAPAVLTATQPREVSRTQPPPEPEVSEDSVPPVASPPAPAVPSATPAPLAAGQPTTTTATTPTPRDIEQSAETGQPILDDPDYGVRSRYSGDADEAKSESDVHGDSEHLLVSLNEYDGDYFLDAMRRENLFGRVAADDVNHLKDADQSCSESEVDDDDIGDDDASDEGVEDIEDDLGGQEGDYTFGLEVEDLRQLGTLGWKTYGEHQIGDLLLDAAADYYDGPSGPTRSAVAYADSPLGMFFYFLPKAMWKKIADESNRYREQNIPVLAAARRAKLLERQQDDPRVSVPSLEEIMVILRKFKPIKAHEIVHVIALLFARAVAPIRDGLAGHWRQGEDGAIPRGTFARYMKCGGTLVMFSVQGVVVAQRELWQRGQDLGEPRSVVNSFSGGSWNCRRRVGVCTS